MATTPTSEIASRAVLKKLFSDGARPSGADFGLLIDSFEHRGERADPGGARDTPASGPGAPAGNASPPPAADGWLAAAARVGRYVPSMQAAKPPFPDGDAVAPGKLPANGKWQVVLPAVNGCCAFEIVAHASGAAASGRHAMLHAIVMTSFNGSRKGIRITRTERGWSWLRRIELRWRPCRSGWFARPTGYDLAIRTHFGYGLDDSGAPTQIRFHITRLW
jgi:hypothetical protein